MKGKDRSKEAGASSSATGTLAPASWVQKSPGVCGGNARIRNTRITVWGLVEWRRLGLSDAEILQRIDGLTQADVEVAWEYFARNPDEIQETIRENEAA